MKFFLNRNFRLMDAKKDDDGGGAGKDPIQEVDLKKQVEDLKAQLAALQTKPDPKKDEDLADQARKQREQEDKKKSELKVLEQAVKFETGVKEFVKVNASLLPKSIADILVLSDKENYDSSIDKANDIKVGIVSEFFALQSNLDLLTETQKNSIAEFKKLTKNDKQAKVNNIYDAIFEPTFEQLKRIEKAKQVSNGIQSPNDVQSKYKEKMEKLSLQRYMGVK